jgi:hypothetical protein
MSRTTFRTLALAILFPVAAVAQGHVHPGAQKPVPTPATASVPDTTHHDDAMLGMADHAMSATSHDDVEMLHMEMTPLRKATREDSAKAQRLVDDIRPAIAKYADPASAEADGYRLFAPSVKNQRVYHYTNYRNAFTSAFRFDPAKPTSILYTRGADGSVHLVGAMYTMPKRASISRLDERVPLSIARWHKHVNWCIPPRGSEARWTERANGSPVFGPQSPIATRAACDAVGGVFYESPFGWMVHVNVNAGSDLGSIFGDDHGHTVHAP